MFDKQVHWFGQRRPDNKAQNQNPSFRNSPASPIWHLWCVFCGHWGFHLSLTHVRSAASVTKEEGESAYLPGEGALTSVHLCCDTGAPLEASEGARTEGARGRLCEGCFEDTAWALTSPIFNFIPSWHPWEADHLFIFCLSVPNPQVAQIKNPCWDSD